MAAGPAQPEPAAVSVHLLLTVGQETQRESGERRTRRYILHTRHSTSPNGSPGTIDDGGTRHGRDDAGHLRDAGFGRGPEVGVGHCSLRFPTGPRCPDARPGLFNGRRRDGQVSVSGTGAGQPVHHGRKRHRNVSLGRLSEGHGPQPENGGRGLAKDAGPQDAYISREDRARSLKADGAVVDALGPCNEGPKIGEVTGIGEAEGLGQDVCHMIDSTGMSPVERGRGGV